MQNEIEEILLDMRPNLIALTTAIDKLLVPKKSSSLSIEDVRVVLSELARMGTEGREEVKSLLKSYGANRLSDVKEENYEEIKQKAEKMLFDKRYSKTTIDELKTEMAMLEEENNEEIDISPFTSDGSNDLNQVPQENYPKLMKAIMALRSNV